jgi:hypothetical protein
MPFPLCPHHHFVKYRLKEEGFAMLMGIVGKIVCQKSRETSVFIDSTPVETSRLILSLSGNLDDRIRDFLVPAWTIGGCHLIF